MKELFVRLLLIAISLIVIYFSAYYIAIALIYFYVGTIALGLIYSITGLFLGFAGIMFLVIAIGGD
ncbi:hypothetical protein F10086_28 [Staphylococcus phage vB_SauM_JDF86]|nr:hypothetical protein F10086_28 [Staphylococcus phage vB_SauM_JDF86]